jgi:ribosomal protein S27E
MTDCKHEMTMIGDLIFQCLKCGHSEIGCSHGRKEIRNGIIKCLICHQTLDSLYGKKSLSLAEVIELLEPEEVTECDETCVISLLLFGGPKPK